jgi:hypothetical protein
MGGVGRKKNRDEIVGAFIRGYVAVQKQTEPIGRRGTGRGRVSSYSHHLEYVTECSETSEYKIHTPGNHPK